jgi:hypothetical protein
MRISTCLACLLLLLLAVAGCQRDESSPPATSPVPVAQPVTPATEEPSAAATPGKEEPAPPKPPLAETFDGEPQLSLFVRVGAYRPEEGDEQGTGYWRTYVDHLLRTCGVAEKAGRRESRGWLLRSIKGVDSVGFFSPLAVEPGAGYRVSFAFKGDLPKGASAGIGVLEFDEFLWIGDQFTQSQVKQHQTGAHEGLRLTGKQEWKEHAFTFTTSPRTRMIHLVLFRDGTEERKQPVHFDDIRIEPAG